MRTADVHSGGHGWNDGGSEDEEFPSLEEIFRYAPRLCPMEQTSSGPHRVRAPTPAGPAFLSKATWAMILRVPASYRTAAMMVRCDDGG